ncbi:MAG TPA: hypothetical protein VM054_08250 [bacterium]|nr:hypothetical protein [bacterium]
MKSFALIILAFTATLAANVVPVDPFLEEIPFGADAEAVSAAMSDAGYTATGTGTFGPESSSDLITGVRGDERLEYRFSGGSQTFARYSVEKASSVALNDKLDEWSERLQEVWGNPAAVSVDGSKLWIVPGMYTIALHIEGAGLLVTVTWD